MKCNIWILFFFASLVFAEKNAKEIVQKSLERDKGNYSVSQVELILINKTKKQRNINVTILEKEEKKVRYTRMMFNAPLDIKGMSFLTHDYSNDKKDPQWMYLPALKKVKRVVSSDKAGSFAGTDFSYSDFTEPALSDFNYKILKEESVNGQEVWKVEAIPVNQTVIEERGNSKEVLYIRKSDYFVVRAIYWLANKKRIKILEAKDIYINAGVAIAKELHMTTLISKKFNHKTIFRLKNKVFNQDITQQKFEVGQLEHEL